jgi:hypothetical protein
MKVLRKVGNIELLEGDGMAKGLFRLAEDIEDVSLKLSLWFDSDEKDELLGLSDDEFVERAIEEVS